MCLYHEILGDAYMALPEQIRELHGPNQSSRWQGTAAVERGTGILARIVTAFIGFPKTIEETQVQVNFTVDETGEHWQRKFGDYKFSSFQRAGRKRNEHLLIERFGIISVALALVTENERIKIIPRSWSCLGIPLPRCLMPNGESYEHVKDDLFHFDVTIKAPIIGHIVSYRGCLKPVK
jgi:hypothetical protein